MPVKLIAFDLDNTFLTTDKTIPQENIDAVRAASELGIYIVPASGRVYSGIPLLLRELDFIRYYIFGNGMSIYDKQEDRIYFRYFIPFDLTLRLMDYADANGIYYDCYQDDRGIIEHDLLANTLPSIIKEPAILALYQSIRTPVTDFRQYITEKGEPVQKMQFYFSDPAERLRQLELLPGLFPELSISSSIPYNIEVNIKEAEKGVALSSLCGMLGISTGDTMAFGDGLNDVGMLSTAGIGVAMSNADEKVKQAADYITVSCNECGVAQAIHRFVLNS